MDTATSARDLLFTLLLKVGVAASFAALLARWNTLRRVLFTEERDVDQKLKLMLFMVPPLILGVNANHPEGVMRAEWGREEFELIKLGGLNFARDQATLLQSEVKRRLSE